MEFVRDVCITLALLLPNSATYIDSIYRIDRIEVNRDLILRTTESPETPHLKNIQALLILERLLNKEPSGTSP